jgi:hypothetical protein
MGASENCRVVLALEGGYHPRGVADCVAEVVAAMIDGEAGRAAAAEVISCTENNDTIPLLYLFLLLLIRPLRLQRRLRFTSTRALP